MSNERGNSRTNSEIGRSLERARAERGLSLWQVEEATKIRARYLHDLERENFDVLPAVYVLGSLKTYADYLGLDGEALSRELKSRQEPPPEERDLTPEEPAQTERGWFLAALGGLPLIGDRDAVGDDRDAAPAAGLGYGSGLYLRLGAVSILVLAIALTTILFWGGDRPAVSEVRDPAIPEAPSRIAFSGNTESKDDRSKEQADPSDGGDEKDEKEDEKDQIEKSDQDDTRPEDTDDVAGAPPASISAASTASASASAAASATSTPAATASVSAQSAVTVPAASAAPQTSEPGARAPAGPRRVGAADGTRPVKRIVGKVRIVRSFSR